jgi:hypothetical protein
MSKTIGKKLTKREVRDVILEFFEVNASRAPITAFEKILDGEPLRDPGEGKRHCLIGIAGLADHQIGNLIFFDQRFENKSMTPTIHSDHAMVETLDRWHASIWQGPAARSHRLNAELVHTWKIIRSEKTGNAVLRFHSADTWKYLPGHAPEQAPAEFHLTSGTRPRRGARQPPRPLTRVWLGRVRDRAGS